MISALRHKSKFKFELKKKQIKTQFRIFFSQIIRIPCCSILEDLSIDVSIANVWLILTKLRWFQLFVKSKIRISNFFEKKIQIFGIPSCSTREDLSIDVSITNVGLILTKLRRFQHVVSYLKFLLLLLIKLKLSFFWYDCYRRWQEKETQLRSQSFILGDTLQLLINTPA